MRAVLMPAALVTAFCWPVCFSGGGYARQALDRNRRRHRRRVRHQVQKPGSRQRRALGECWRAAHRAPGLSRPKCDLPGLPAALPPKCHAPHTRAWCGRRIDEPRPLSVALRNRRWTSPDTTLRLGDLLRPIACGGRQSGAEHLRAFPGSTPAPKRPSAAGVAQTWRGSTKASGPSGPWLHCALQARATAPSTQWGPWAGTGTLLPRRHTEAAGANGGARSASARRSHARTRPAAKACRCGMHRGSLETRVIAACTPLVHRGTSRLEPHAKLRNTSM